VYAATLNHLKLAEASSQDWAALADRALQPNPFHHPDFVVPAARLQGDDVSVLVAGDWDAVLPVAASRWWRGLPLPHVRAWVHDQCFLGTPLVADVAAVPSLVDALSATRRGALAELDLTAGAGPVSDALDAALPASAIAFGAYTRAALERRAEPTYLDGRLSGKHRRAYRRAARDLGAHLGGELAVVDHAGDPAAVDVFLALEGAGWKGRQGTALACLPGGAEFLHAVCAAFAERGALQLLFLEANGHVAAARLNLRAGDELFCFKIAFDETLRKFSPGMQLELAMIDRFHADPTLQRMDSCTDPRSEMFNRLWPDRKPLRGVLLPRGLAGAALQPGLLRAAERISSGRAAEAVARAA
jgi:CelD/BcsL family acetyltransferase involved in cellulose biosynthesis